MSVRVEAFSQERRPFLLRMMMLLSLMPTAVQCATAEGTLAAGKLRASADTAFASGELDKAVRFLSQAIQIEPDNEKNHYKRYRAYLRGKKYKEALQDLTASINLDPNNVQKLQQRAKLYKMMGRCGDAVEDFMKLQGLGPTEDKEGLDEAWRCNVSIQESEKLMEAGQWEEAREHLDRAVAATEIAPDLLLRRARCNFNLKDYYGATADTGRTIKLEPGNVNALELRALSYYHLGEFEMAQTHFREALKFDPEHKGSLEGHRQLKKMLKASEKGQEALDRGAHKEAVEELKAAIALDPNHKTFAAPLWVKVAKSHQQLKEFGLAKTAAQHALDMDDSLEDAHIIMGDVLIGNEEYDEAVRVLRRASEKFQGNGRFQEALKKAEIALKQSKEVNYYRVLGVERNADTSDIKRAYRGLAKIYHPDKQANMTPEEKEKAEKEFVKIAEAYEVLSNDELRAKYDRGEDVSGQAQQHAGGNPFGGFGGFGGAPFGQQHFTFHFQ